MKKQVFILTFIAALIRLFSVDSVFNGDEPPNFFWYSFVPWKSLIFSYTESGQHTLSIALARLSMSVFGESEVAFRLPVLLAGILSVPLLYKLVIIFFSSKEVATISSSLLTLSYYPIYYSQHGRSYSLTLFLALALIYVVIKIIDGKALSLWGLTLSILGISMVLALPSNGGFLASVTIFFLLSSWDKDKGIRGYLNKIFLKKSVYFFLMFALVIAYLIIIYPDITRAIKLSKSFEIMNKGTLGFTPIWISNIFSFLVEPWGFWLYLFFSYGLWIIKSQRMFYPMLGLFFTPIFLNIATGIFGPDRIYIYWVPFVLMIISIGLVEFIKTLKMRLGSRLSMSFVILFSLVILTQSGLKLGNYYQRQLNLEGTKIADAKHILPFIDNIKKSRQLIIVHYSESVLMHYIGKIIFENNFQILSEGKLENILFVSHSSRHPKDLNWIGTFNHIPENFFELVRTYGKFRFYRYSGKISNLEPIQPNPDYERSFSGVRKSDVATLNSSSRIIGNQSLLIQAALGKVKTVEDCLGLDFSRPPSYLEPSGRYILLTYIKHFKQSSTIFLKNDDGHFMHSTQLNYNYNLFIKAENVNKPTLPYWQQNEKDMRLGERIDGAKLIWRKQPPLDYVLRQFAGNVFPRPGFYWKTQFILSPIKIGTNFKFINFRVCDAVSTFDGIKTFLLLK